MDQSRCKESSVPDSIAAAIWFTGTTKKSHAYITVIDGFIILDYEGPGRASGFHSHHHIDDKSPHRTRSSNWLVQPGSIHESLVQLSLGDTVEKMENPVLNDRGKSPMSRTVTSHSSLMPKRNNFKFEQGYEVVAFLSVTSKVAASASATRIFDIPFYFSSNEWYLLLEILAILSMILGNLGP
ncbi:hypothetical protein V6N11_005853 [Hibiscus sabdariffa]|uniref:NADH:quinone oxidoreductase/Mrp antiporter transmembrane domain-containing protein n=1 Tax=Hibiscus sabdariffa TaxID=183260 RepID=A0ABR2RPB6_9ROSI